MSAVRLTRRAALSGLATTAGSRVFAQTPWPDPEPETPLGLTGRACQGGFLMGLYPNSPATIRVDGEEVGRTPRSGIYIVGIDRDSKSLVDVRLWGPRHGQYWGEHVAIAPVTYDVQRIDGLPTDQVEPSDPALLEHFPLNPARILRR